MGDHKQGCGMKIGDTLYSVTVDEGLISATSYVVRSKRHGSFYLIVKNSATWVKLSRKNGDWGWAANIPDCFRTDHPIGASITHHYFLANSKIAAAKKALSNEQKWLKRRTKSAYRHEIDKDVTALKRYIQRLGAAAK